MATKEDLNKSIGMLFSNVNRLVGFMKKKGQKRNTATINLKGSIWRKEVELGGSVIT